jgi:hypothetical protein
MPLAHDVELRKAMNTWIEEWRNYALRNPGNDSKSKLAYREKMYQDIITMLDSRSTLTIDPYPDQSL